MLVSHIEDTRLKPEVVAREKVSEKASKGMLSYLLFHAASSFNQLCCNGPILPTETILVYFSVYAHPMSRTKLGTCDLIWFDLI